MKITEDRQDTNQEIERVELIRQFAAIDEHSREARVDRYLKVNSRRVIGSQYFARASTECIALYSDGHYIATVMMTQAVNEGILKFVAQRNGIDYENMTRANLLATLLSEGIISKDCYEASKQILKSFRNDVHHMNPRVATIWFTDLAKENIQNLALIEHEIWATNFKDGKLIPIQPKYWDIKPDGTMPIYLR